MKPEARPQNITEFRQLLGLAPAAPPPDVRLSSPAEPVLKHTIAVSPAGLTEPARPGTRFRPALYGFGVILLLALIAGGWFLTRNEPQVTPEPAASGKDIAAMPAPSGGEGPLGKVQGKYSAGPASTPEVHEPLGPAPVAPHVLPETKPRSSSIWQ